MTWTCPSAGGSHISTGSGNYTLTVDNATAPGQNDWMWCNKCSGLSYSRGTSQGPCARGGMHTHDGSGNYNNLVLKKLPPTTRCIHRVTRLWVNCSKICTSALTASSCM